MSIYLGNQLIAGSPILSANPDLSNLSSTGKAVIDGQWVFLTSNVTLSNTTVLGSYTIDLSSYIPNDNYDYEILIWSRMGSVATEFNYMIIGSDLITAELMINFSGVNGTGFNTCTIPVRNRSITLRLTSNNGQNLQYMELVLAGYRRIGTNS